jgi:hypothetical protein
MLFTIFMAIPSFGNLHLHISFMQEFRNQSFSKLSYNIVICINYREQDPDIFTFTFIHFNINYYKFHIKQTKCK